jgi:hypothetical protein
MEIPYDVTGFLNLPDTSSRDMALKSSQPLTKVSTRNFSGSRGRPALKADNLIAICELRRPTSLWASTICHSDSITLSYVSYF